MTDEPSELPESKQDEEKSVSPYAISRFDGFCIFALIAYGYWLFGSNSRLLGFYADDAGFMTAFRDMSLDNMFWRVAAYVPGRNLHNLWQYLIFAVTGGPSLDSLAAAHRIQALFTSGNAALLYVLLRKFSLGSLPAAAAACLFLLGPTHGDVHFWASGLPMNLVSTFFVLWCAILAVTTVRAASKGAQSRATLLLFLGGLVSIAGIFTYDQPAPVVVTIEVFTALLVSWHCRRLALPALSLAALIVALPIVVLFWKSHNVGNGPPISAVHMDQLVLRFQESLNITAGRTFKIALVDRTLAFSTRKIRVQAEYFSIAFLLLGFLCVWWDSRLKAAIPALSWKRLSLLFIGAAAFFLLAYFPAYLWFISPRHTYLPGIGTACAIGVLLAAFQTALRRGLGRQVTAVFGLLIVCGISWGAYFLSQSILVDKKAWSTSYQARRHFYEDFSQDPKFLSATLLVTDSIPLMSPFGSAFLGYQNNMEPSLMTRGASKATFVRPFSLQAPSGDFIKVEVGEWGPESFVFIPKDEIFRVHYEGLDIKKMRYNLAPASTPPLPVKVEQLADVPTFEGKAHLEATERGTLELSVRPTHIPRESVLAVIPLVGDRASPRPLTLKAADGPTYLDIIELPYADHQPAVRYRLSVPQESEKVIGVSLYVVGSSKRVRLADAFLE